MLTYEQVLAVVARHVQRGAGRRMNTSLSLDLLTCCRDSLCEAAVALSSPPSPTALGPRSSTAGAASFAPTRTLVSSAAAPDVLRDALQVVRCHPLNKAFFARARGDRVVITLFTSQPIFADATNAASAKDVLTVMLISANVKEMSSAQLLLAMQVLTWYRAGSSQSAVDRTDDVSDVTSSSPMQQQHNAATGTAFLTAAREVVSHLQSANATHATPTTGPQTSCSRSFQRRKASGDLREKTNSSATEGRPVYVATPDDEDGQPSIRQMVKTSSTARISSAEFLILLGVLLDAWKDEGRCFHGTAPLPAAELQEVHRLLAAVSRALPAQPLYITSATGNSRSGDTARRPLSYAELNVLVKAVCVPTGIRQLSDFGLAGLQKWQERANASSTGVGVLSAVPKQRRIKLRSQAIRQLLSRDRDARWVTALVGKQSCDLLSVLPCVVFTLLRGEESYVETGEQQQEDAMREVASQNLYSASVAQLPLVYRAQLFYLLCRAYDSHVGALHRQLALGTAAPDLVTLSVEQLVELDMLAEAVWQHSLDTFSQGEFSAQHRHQHLELELRTLQLLAHHLTEGAGGVGELEAHAFLELVKGFLPQRDAEDDVRPLLSLRDWGRLLEALSLWLDTTPPGDAAATEEAVRLFCAALRTLARLFALPDAAVHGTEFGRLRGHIAFSTLHVLKQQWNGALLSARNESFRGPVSNAIRGVLHACIQPRGHTFDLSSPDPSEAVGEQELSSSTATAPHAVDDATITAVALKFLLYIGADGDGRSAPTEQECGKAHMPVRGDNHNTASSRAATTEHGNYPDLSSTVLKESIAHSLEDYSRKEASELTVYDLVNVLQLVNSLFQLGILDPPLLALSVSAMRNTGTPDILVTFSWKQRVVVLRACAHLYRAAEPHFSSHAGCRQLGQQCLVLPTRLCLSKYAPQLSQQEQQQQQLTGSSLDANIHVCAELVWQLCVKATQKPLRQSSLDKYLLLMARFVRRYWREPPHALAELTPEARSSTLRAVENELKVLRAKGGSADGFMPVAGTSSEDDVMAGTLRYNSNLLHMAVQLLPLTLTVVREDGEVRARKIKRYYEIYFTMCFLLMKHPTAVVPSVWYMALQHAVNYPRVFSREGHFTLMLQKTLEVSAREVLRHAEANGNVGQWADSRSNRSQNEVTATIPTAAGFESSAQPPHGENEGISVLLSPRMIPRIVGIISSLSNVDARLTLLRLAQQLVNAPPANTASRKTAPSNVISSSHPSSVGHEVVEADCGARDEMEAEALRRARRGEISALMQIINGLRQAGRRSRKA